MRGSNISSPLAKLTVILIWLLLFVWIPVSSQAQRRREKKEKEEPAQRRFDDPAEADDLNRELWEFARPMPYQEMLRYVAAEQRKSKAVQKSEIELPNGWRIAPAGRQIEVGRLPYEAVPYQGKLVVLDTGYYYKEPQEVSIVDTARGEVV
ncbi:MAG TPA: hypothetical protein VIX17_26750, partial [Pyrinomonadaceae bacterium]